MDTKLFHCFDWNKNIETCSSTICSVQFIVKVSLLPFCLLIVLFLSLILWHHLALLFFLFPSLHLSILATLASFVLPRCSSLMASLLIPLMS